MKKIKIKHIILLFLSLSVFLISCEKEITLDLPPATPKIVIEGVIETNQYSYVYITKNMGFFDAVDTNTLQNILITDAVVTVSNGTETDTLKLVYNPKYVPPIRYEGSKIKGEVGMSYNLKVEHDGKVFESVTTIPPIVEIDSIKFSYRAETDTFGFLWVYFQDPPELGNFYRAFSKVEGKDSVFVHQTYSTGDDKLVNGQLIEYTVVRGMDPAMPSENYEIDPNSDEPPYWAIFVGDKITVKLCSIDAINFEFWKSVETQYSSNGNPFAAPTTLKTNISGDALGIWGGYAASIDTVTVTEDIIVDFNK